MREYREGIDDIYACLEDFCNINEEQIKEELLTHSKKYAWIVVLYEKAKIKRERLQFSVDVKYAELYRKYRESSNGKLTEKHIESIIYTDEDYKRLVEELMRAKEEELLLKALVSAGEHKKDMLVSYVSLVKEEMKSLGFVESVLNDREVER
ncbi:MAG: hypothetical protein QXR17_06800 [Candidatus Bathyarchaeia archaeon]